MSKLLTFNTTPAVAASDLVVNPTALASVFSRTLMPNVVTAYLLEGDSVPHGTGASSILKSYRYLLRKKLQDTWNAHFGGSAKSGVGRIAPFFPWLTGSITGAAVGPIILPTGAGWRRYGAGSAVDGLNTYWTEKMRVTVQHPGSISPAVGTHYCGCYMLFNPSASSPIGGVKWISVILAAAMTGTVRIQAYQGANITAAVAAGANVFSMQAGAFGGSDVPDPDAVDAERKFDVTIDGATYLDSLLDVITGHLNSTALDPTIATALCFYRTSNAATTAQITGIDGHYDEYTAQNTPRSDGALAFHDFTWPGDTDQGEQSGASTHGTNSDFMEQDVAKRHTMEESRRYIHPTYTHSMPRVILAISNEWRNQYLAADQFPSPLTPTLFRDRLVEESHNYGRAGIVHLYVNDIGTCASYLCDAINYLDGAGTNYNCDSYVNAMLEAVTTCKGHQALQHVDGALSIFHLDLAFGTGGIDGAVKAGVLTSSDCVHYNDAGQQLMANIMGRLLGGNLNVGRVKPGRAVTRVRNRDSLTTRAGVSKTTVLSFDPNDMGSMKIGATGFRPVGDNQSFDKASGYHARINDGAAPGTDLTTTIRGTDGEIRLLTEAFGERAGLFFNNATNKNNRVVETIALAQPLTQFTVVYVLQNLWLGTIASFPNSKGFYWQFGNATDDGRTYTDIYEAWSNGALSLVAANGLTTPTAIMHTGTGFTQSAIAIGSHPTVSGSSPHDPHVGCVRIDMTAKTWSSNISPTQSWTNGTLHANIAASFNPTRVCFGGSLGTGAACIPCNFGGLWIINGLVTDDEFTHIFDQLQKESGYWFPTGTTFNDFGALTRY